MLHVKEAFWLAKTALERVRLATTNANQSENKDQLLNEWLDLHKSDSDILLHNLSAHTFHRVQNA